MYTTTTVAFGGGYPIGPSLGMRPGPVITVLVPWTPQFGAAYQQFLNSGLGTGMMPPMGMPYGGGLPLGGGFGGLPSYGLGGLGGMPSYGLGGYGGLPGNPIGFGVTSF